MHKYDVLVIGGGPIGLTCGIAAKQAGLSYVIVEKGCLVNSLYNYPANMSFFSTSEKLEIGEVPFMSIANKPTRNEALEYYRRVTQVYELNLHLFEAVQQVVRNEEGSFEVRTSKQIFLTKNLIVSTGFYDLPVMLSVPGEDLDKVRHYYKDPNYYAFQKVVVVGASNSSVDAALETWRKGADVTMIVRQAAISERVKYWVKPDIENRIKEGSIKAYFNSSVQSISKDAVVIQTPEGVIHLANDFVLALTGYKPNFSFLKTLGVQLSADEKLYPTYNTDTMETNQTGIYLAGVVVGGMDTHKWFIENSRDHAGKIVAHIVKSQN